MNLRELIKTENFVDFKFVDDNIIGLYSTSGGEVLPSEIYNHEYDSFLSLSAIVMLLDKEVEIVKDNSND